MATVKQNVIDEIRSLGMSKALAKAHSNEASAEFREGVKRFYPKAQFGPKTAAAAQGSTQPSSNGSAPAAAAPPPPKEVGDTSPLAPGQKRKAGPPLPTQASPAAKAAIKRRTEYKSTADKSEFAGQYVARKTGDALNKVAGSGSRPKVNPNYKSTADDTEFAGTNVARKMGDAFSGKNPNAPKISNLFKGKSDAQKAKEREKQQKKQAANAAVVERNMAARRK